MGSGLNRVFRTRPAQRAPARERLDFGRIRDIPIASVAADLGFKLNARGGGLCRLPGHDDHNPSFALRLRSNSFQCFACRRHGSVIDLVMEMEGLDLISACRWLSERYLGARLAGGQALRALAPARASASPPTALLRTVAPDTELNGWLLDQSPLAAEGRAYLTGRGFSGETLAAFRIGQVGNRSALRRAAIARFGVERMRRCGLLYDGRWGTDLVFPSRYLLFPFLINGAVSYLQARRSDDRSDFRWVCPANMLPPAFNLDVLDQNHATVLICEGVTDTLSAHELGHPAIGLTGAKAHFDPTTMARLRGRNILLIGDRDAAGQGFAREMVQLLSRQSITAIARALPAGVNDLNDLLRKQRGLA